MRSYDLYLRDPRWRDRDRVCALRFQRMRIQAKRLGKRVPSYEELDRALPSDMLCPVCAVLMVWRAKIAPKRVITLQHDQSGEIRLICQSCNSRHAAYGDSFYNLPPEHKRCCGCKRIKPFGDFPKDRTQGFGLSPFCFECNRQKCSNYHKQRSRV